MKDLIDAMRTRGADATADLRAAVRRWATNDVREMPDGGFQMSASMAPGKRLLPRGLGNAPLAALIPGESATEYVVTTGLFKFVGAYTYLMTVRIILTFLPNPPAFMEGPLSQICDPYLRLFRGVLPPLNGMIDLSPIIAFASLDFFNSLTAALPAEIPGADNERAMQPRLGRRERRAARRAEKAARQHALEVQRQVAAARQLPQATVALALPVASTPP